MNNIQENTRKIRRGIALTMTALAAALVLVLMLANNLLLGRFYLHEKTKTLEKAFESINSQSESEDIYSEEYSYTLEKLCANENLGVMVMSSDGTLLLSSQNQSETMIGQLFDIMLKDGADGSAEIISGENYNIRRGRDSRTDNEYLLLWGNLSDGNIILMRTSVESIKYASQISNRLLIYIGIGIMILAVIAAELISKRLTRSMKELSDANASLENDIRVSQENERMRREFLSNVSHELKTPIALIQGYAEGLQEGVGADDASFYQEVIIDEARKMNALVQKLLSLNRLEYGASSAQNEAFDLTDMIEGVVSKNELPAEERGISIKFEPPDFSCEVWADPLLSEQVITNYITNAIHYCAGDPGYIDIKLKKEDENLRFLVFNTGIPIDEEKLPHIWEKFYKADPARTREYGGTGIGLSIVRAVADEMKGDCGVINYDNGVEFWFDFHFFVED